MSELSVIQREINRALDSVEALQKFSIKHRDFLAVHEPEMASGLVRPPWISFDRKLAGAVAAYFGNDGWVAATDGKEKLVDGVNVGVHGMHGVAPKVSLVTKGPASAMPATATATIGLGALHSLN